MRGIHVFVGAIVAVILGAIGAGLYVSGTPEQVRREKLDARRLSDLRRISDAIDNHWKRHGALPTQLAKLDVSIRYTVDPETRDPYAYRAIDPDTYELCAVFDTQCDGTEGGCSEDWRKDPQISVHGAGRHCFEVHARVPE